MIFFATAIMVIGLICLIHIGGYCICNGDDSKEIKRCIQLIGLGFLLLVPMAVFGLFIYCNVEHSEILSVFHHIRF